MKRATVLMAVAFVVISCKGKLGTTKVFDISQAPYQIVDSMFVVQTDKGGLKMRMEAVKMERYKNDTLDWEIFPDGFKTYAYDETGRLETEIIADKVRHIYPKKGDETWEATGNVIVRNLIKKETMETDTLFWDRRSERIHTDSYVRLLSPSGFMQGYGMESDQRARTSVILHPFDSYGIVQEDSTTVEIDTVNFIGPFPKK